MAVIKDVAAHAGVSVGSVSRYLNFPNELKEETRKKIEAAITELNYCPSPLARSMRTGTTGVIAVAVPEIVNPFFAETYSAIHRVAGARGLSTILYTTDSNLATLKECLSERSVRQVDGAILCFLDEDEAVADYLGTVAKTIPIVLLSRDLAVTRFDSVVVDVFSGMKTSASHLAAIGRKRIAYVGGPSHNKISSDKHMGYLRALEQYDLQSDPDLVSRGEFSMKSGYAAARRFMMLPNPPDGIVAENDILAMGCMKFLLQSKCQVPEQVALCGFDNIGLAAMYEPSLTTIAIPIESMAIAAIEMMSRSIHKRTTKHTQSILPTELIVRRSTDPQVPVILD